MRLASTIVFLICFSQLYLAQIDPGKLNMQSDKHLIEFNNTGKWYTRSELVNDTIKQTTGRTGNFPHFLDSLKKAGYVNKAPVSVTKNITFTLEITDHRFLRVDTIFTRWTVYIRRHYRSL